MRAPTAKGSRSTRRRRAAASSGVTHAPMNAAMAAMPERQRIIPRMLTPDLLEFHAFCLTNTGTRLAQYSAALAQVIRPGDTVLDLGAGFGILGVLACRAGARRVHAVEASDACAMGREVVQAAQMADRVTFFHGSSFDF